MNGCVWMQICKHALRNVKKMIIAIHASCFSHTVRGKFTYRRNAVEAVAPVASCCQDSWHFVKQCEPLLLWLIYKQDYTEAQFLWAHTLFNQLISRFQVQILGSIEKRPHRLFRKPSSTGVQHVSHANKNPERLRTTNKVFLDVYVGSEKKNVEPQTTQEMLGRGNWVILTSEAFKILVLKFSTISNMFMQMEHNHSLLQNQEYGLVKIIQKKRKCFSVKIQKLCLIAFCNLSSYNMENVAVIPNIIILFLTGGNLEQDRHKEHCTN